MILPIGATVVRMFETIDSSGVRTAPSVGPTAVVYKNGVVDSGTATTVTNISTGLYKISYLVDDTIYANNDTMVISVLATVGGNSKQVLWLPDAITNAQLDTIEELLDQATGALITIDGNLGPINTRTLQTANAVSGTGVVINATSVGALQAAMENDPQMQLLLALSGVAGGRRTDFTGGIETWVMNKPAGGTITAVFNQNTKVLTVS